MSIEKLKFACASFHDKLTELQQFEHLYPKLCEELLPFAHRGDKYINYEIDYTDEIKFDMYKSVVCFSNEKWIPFLVKKGFIVDPEDELLYWYTE